MALIRIHKEHDLVLEFGYPGERKKFLAKLENFLSVRVSVQNPGGSCSPKFLRQSLDKLANRI